MTQLTISLENNSVRTLQNVAKKNDKSLEEYAKELLECYVHNLQRKGTKTLHPEIEKFSGIVPSDIYAEQLYNTQTMYLK